MQFSETSPSSSLVFVVVERLLAIYGEYSSSGQKNGAQVALIVVENHIEICRADQNARVVHVHRRRAGAIRIGGVRAGECLRNDRSVEARRLRAGQIA